MEWEYEQEKEYGVREVRVLVGIERRWYGGGGDYTIFHYPPLKSYWVQVNGEEEREDLGDLGRYRSLRRAKAACERDWEKRKRFLREEKS
jgi:hypothetical protein